MFDKLFATLNWLPTYAARELRRTLQGERVPPKQVYVSVCDHFEPYWNKADKTTARKRLQRWLDEYPKIADKYRDTEGNILKWSFFYPEEEYQKDDLDALASLCHAGYGEVEIHLHHDNDTPENLRRTLLDFKHRLHEQHCLLHRDPETGEIIYGFIHGNWALCNSRKDGCWCGVNEEIKILLETGCYADFTLPTAPSETQTRKVNSIYYAQDIPGKPKSHDWGVDAEVGKKETGLLMVQGPLMLDWGRRKFGLIPRLEYSGLLGNFGPTRERTKLWLDAGISVKGAPDQVFVKLYTHGTQEDVMQNLFDDGGLSTMFESLHQCGVPVKFVSAWEMVEEIRNIMSKG
jgi:hypothetical protein